jgi:ubiquinone/menaquinone biosynthesis C-methylase UbiE
MTKKNRDKRKKMVSLRESKFLSKLAEYYAHMPSAVLIRTAEVEILRTMPLEPPLLDLCCGDGFICSLICPDGVEAGCDLSLDTLKEARERTQYHHIACADVTKGVPFRNSSFRTVVSNSSLEHLSDISAALREIARVLKPGGKVYATFGSNFAYEWCCVGHRARKRYLDFQPVYNYFSLQEWKERMSLVGLEVVAHRYYLSKAATRLVCFLDYHFSRAYMTSDKSVVKFIIHVMHRIPSRVWSNLWIKLFGRIRTSGCDKGGGILIVAERESIL